MPDSAQPQFRDLDEAEIDALLARNCVGHLAFAQDGSLEVLPIHYVHDGMWLYGRTSVSEKLESLQEHWWVAFGVDEIEGMFDWRSVQVHGGFYPLRPNGTAQDRERWTRALTALRRLIPETLEEGDPVPFRTVVFGIAVQEKTGKMATTST